MYRRKIIHGILTTNAGTGSTVRAGGITAGTSPSADALRVQVRVSENDCNQCQFTTTYELGIGDGVADGGTGRELGTVSDRGVGNTVGRLADGGPNS